MLKDNVGGVSDVPGDPIRPAILAGAIAGLDENGANPGVLSAADIARFVADKKGATQIESMVALRFENHPRAGLSANRVRRRQIGTIITRVDQAVAELAKKFLLYLPVNFLRKIAAPDPALVCDDHKLVAFFL